MWPRQGGWQGGIDESFDEEDDKKLAMAAGGQVIGETQREKDQAHKIAKLEAELDRIKSLSVSQGSPPGFSRCVIVAHESHYELYMQN